MVDRFKVNPLGKDPELRAFLKLQEYLERLAESGIWSNQEQVKPVEGSEFFEFKIKKVHRIFWYYDPRNRAVVVITHHAEKKRGRLSKEDLERMKEIRRSFERRRNQ